MSHTQFTRDDRMSLAELLWAGKKQSAIAQRLGKDPGAVSREIKRNKDDDGIYRAAAAHRKAKGRRRDAKAPSQKIRNDPSLQKYIVNRIEHYWSPEQISGGTLDPRSDFFSLGIVLYELATGKRPFLSENLTGLIKAIRESSYVRARKLRPSLSALTEELIDRLLSRDPDHRPSSAKEILEALNHCVNSYLSFGTSRKVAVPFAFKRYFPSVALVCSVIALIFSGIAAKDDRVFGCEAAVWRQEPFR